MAVARTPRQSLAAGVGLLAFIGQMGLARADGWAGVDWVGPTGSAQQERIGFLFIF
jgi:hypothetical protein